eukprot:365144-Chlamydomonas_euryale.AAC.2
MYTFSLLAKLSMPAWSPLPRLLHAQGVAANPLLAKLASAESKPDGLLVLTHPRQVWHCDARCDTVWHCAASVGNTSPNADGGGGRDLPLPSRPPLTLPHVAAIDSRRAALRPPAGSYATCRDCWLADVAASARCPRCL